MSNAPSQCWLNSCKLTDEHSRIRRGSPAGCLIAGHGDWSAPGPAGSHSSIGLLSGSCSLANRPWGYFSGSTFTSGLYLDRTRERRIDPSLNCTEVYGGVATCKWTRFTGSDVRYPAERYSGPRSADGRVAPTSPGLRDGAFNPKLPIANGGSPESRADERGDSNRFDRPASFSRSIPVSPTIASDVRVRRLRFAFFLIGGNRVTHGLSPGRARPRVADQRRIGGLVLSPYAERTPHLPSEARCSARVAWATCPCGV
jgi:hypothetical protein